MKNTILLGCLLVFGALAQAKTITVEVPDHLFGSETQINGNFDGSITVNNPKVFFNGYWSALANEAGSESTGLGICFLLQKQYVSFSNYSTGRVRAVMLSRAGEISGTTVTENPIGTIVCR